MKPKKEFRRIVSFSVHFDETDMLGVAHNSVYFKWFERGRLALLEELLPIEEAMANGLAAFVIRNACQYKHPARYGDRLVLTTKMPFSEPYPGRLRFIHELSNGKSKVEVAVGESELSLINTKTGRLVKEVPESMLQRLRNTE